MFAGSHGYVPSLHSDSFSLQCSYRSGFRSAASRWYVALSFSIWCLNLQCPKERTALIILEGAAVSGVIETLRRSWQSKLVTVEYAAQRRQLEIEIVATSQINFAEQKELNPTIRSKEDAPGFGLLIALSSNGHYSDAVSTRPL